MFKYFKLNFRLGNDSKGGHAGGKAKKDVNMILCPLCSKSFPQKEIEVMTSRYIMFLKIYFGFFPGSCLNVWRRRFSATGPQIPKNHLRNMRHCCVVRHRVRIARTVLHRKTENVLSYVLAVCVEILAPNWGIE